MEKLFVLLWLGGVFLVYLFLFCCVYARELENKGPKNSPGLWCPSASPTPGYSFLLSIQKGIIFPSKEVCKVLVFSSFVRICLGMA